MSSLHYLSPFLGAVLFEAVHWFRIREKLDLPKYRKLLRSPAYWVITAVAVLLGGLGALVYFGDRLSPGELLVAGAAFPTLLKKLVAAFTDKQATVLGAEPDEGGPVADYFAAA